MLLLCPGPLITPMICITLMRTQFVSLFHHWCPSLPNYPAREEQQQATQGWYHPWIVLMSNSTGKYYLSSLAWDIFFNPTLAFWFGRDFSSWFHARPQARQREQRLSWRASAFYCLFFLRLALSGLSPSFSLGHCLDPLNQVFTGPQGCWETWGVGTAVGFGLAESGCCFCWAKSMVTSVDRAQHMSLLSAAPSPPLPAASTHLSSHWIFALKTWVCFCVFLQQALVKLLTERLLKMFPRAGGCWASSSGRAWGGLLVLDDQTPVSYLK